MSVSETHAASDEDTRRAAFAALVTAQDDGLSVGPSRRFVADKFGLGLEKIRDIEREGLSKGWPPL